MRGRPKTARLEALREALRTQAAAVAEIERFSAIAANVLHERDRNESELEQVLARTKDVVAAAMLEGKTASPEPADVATATRLQAQIGAADTAHMVALRQVEQASEAARPTESTLAVATVAYCNELRADALAKARDTLTQLSQPLADLAAADRLQHHLIGESFKVGAKVEPFFAGRPLAQSLVAKIPDRLRPDDLILENFQALITAKFADRLGTTKENSNDEA